MVKYQYFCDNCGEEIEKINIEMENGKFFEMTMEGYFGFDGSGKEHGHICLPCVYKALTKEHECT